MTSGSGMRLASVADAPALARLHLAVWQVAYRGLIPDAFLDALTVEEFEQRWASQLREGHQLVLAFHEGALVGFASYGASRDEAAPGTEGELFALYVHPDAWGTPVGWRLHDAALSALTSAQMSEATLWVLASNERARRFYDRQGWQPDGGVKVEERPGATLTEVRYRRLLRGSQSR